MKNYELIVRREEENENEEICVKVGVKRNKNSFFLPSLNINELKSLKVEIEKFLNINEYGNKK